MKKKTKSPKKKLSGTLKMSDSLSVSNTGKQTNVTSKKVPSTKTK